MTFYALTVNVIRGYDILCSDSECARTYYHYVCDEGGSTSHILDETGKVLNQYEYDAFGNLIKAQEEVNNRFLYVGQQYDAVTMQYYLRARYYNPVVARFTQEDTYRGDGLNLYAYCQNNPVGYYDPSGHNTKDCGLSKKGIVKGKQLPTKGKIRYIPPENWNAKQPLPKTNGGYIDKFGNIWIKGPSRTQGQAFEWDVQLSKRGKEQLGWLSRDGSHLNVSLDGKITHK